MNAQNEFKIARLRHALMHDLSIAYPMLAALAGMVAHHTPGEWVDTSGPQYAQLNAARAAIAPFKS